MAFIKKYEGTTNVRLLRMQRFIWISIYVGLLTMVLGYFAGDKDEAMGTVLCAVGGLAVAIGALMIYIRSRLREE
jgi:hypothetical protein